MLKRLVEEAVLGRYSNGLPDPVDPPADARRNRIVPELDEPDAVLKGQNVVADYRLAGLSLRQHPVAFLRGKLQERRMIPCADLARARDGRRGVAAGLVLVRQRPGSAKGVMFITIEDKTGMVNLVLWADRFEAQRSLVLSAGMIACHGRAQREGEVIHAVTDRLEDLSGMLRSVGDRDDPFPIDHGRGDGASHPSGPDPRSAGIRVATRDFC